MSSHAADIQVVIPARNAARTLERAVASVLAQSFSAWRLVIVDDRSRDGTGAIAERLAGSDRRITAVRNEGAAGAAGARNYGVSLGAEPLIGFLDSDDEYLPDMLASTVAALAKHPDRDAAKVAFVLDDDVDAARREAIYASSAVNQVLRRAAFQVVGGFPLSPPGLEASWPEDIAFNQLFHWSFNTLHLPEALYRVHANPGSATRDFLGRAGTGMPGWRVDHREEEAIINEAMMELLAHHRARLRRRLLGLPE